MRTLHANQAIIKWVRKYEIDRVFFWCLVAIPVLNSITLDLVPINLMRIAIFTLIVIYILREISQLSYIVWLYGSSATVVLIAMYGYISEAQTHNENDVGLGLGIAALHCMMLLGHFVYLKTGKNPFGPMGQ